MVRKDALQGHCNSLNQKRLGLNMAEKGNSNSDSREAIQEKEKIPGRSNADYCTAKRHMIQLRPFGGKFLLSPNRIIKPPWLTESTKLKR